MSRTEWQLFARDKALKYIDRLSEDESLRIWQALAKTLDFLSEKESPTDIGLKILHGKMKGFHRLRVGKWRIILEIDNSLKRVNVFEIDTRGSVYK